MRRKKLWRVWAKALGSKESNCDKEADTVAVVRTFIFASYLITNIAIVANAWRHWNDSECSLQATKKESLSSPFKSSEPQ
jgi:hypothetical protein